jgi:carboxymethylenebutenolidase
MRKTFILAFVLALAAPLFAADELATYKSGKDDVVAFLVRPEGKGPHPAVVLIHEWWGINDWVKDQARALAKEGYVALAVDLYRGKSTDSQEEAHQLMMGLPEERAVADLKAAIDFLAGHPGIRKDAIGVVGWCMGGKWAFKTAVVDSRVAAVVGYYGMPPQDAAALKKIKAPVLGNFGAEDKGPSPEQAKAFEAALKKQGTSVDIKVYEGAGHAFANPNNPWKGYREEAAKDAWARTVAFLDKHLKKTAKGEEPAARPKK